MDFPQPLSIEQAQSLGSLDLVWRATLRSGEVILEQPGVSSDSLPRDEVVEIAYLPTRQNTGYPVITCRVDLARGEHFVRYWTTVWRNGGGTQRLYVLGVENRGRYCLVAFYPKHRKIVVANTKPFQPPWNPETYKLLPSDTIFRGGQGHNFSEWLNDGFGGALLAPAPGMLQLHAIYE
jgi:hypothetical protein